MDAVAILRREDRAALFQQVASRRGQREEVWEKDFWVCWTLKRLFPVSKGQPGLLFKGGTSLSKVYRLISRFSEDIDLSVDRHDLGFVDGRDPLNASSRNRAQKLTDELATKCVAHIQTELLPQLISEFSRVLGAEPGSNWDLEVSPADPQTLLFRYPSAFSDAENLAAYLLPTVRLELGARADHWPASTHLIKPYAAEDFPGFFSDSECAVHVLSAERTFWEKATILHMEYHREKFRAHRTSRHYYDMVMLARSKVRQEALAQLELLTDVAKHKKVFFPATWARYDDARPGTLRLVPNRGLSSALARDYEEMAEYFFEDPPSFETLLAELEDLEAEVNSS